MLLRLCGARRKQRGENQTRRSRSNCQERDRYAVPLLPSARCDGYKLACWHSSAAVRNCRGVGRIRDRPVAVNVESRPRPSRECPVNCLHSSGNVEFGRCKTIHRSTGEPAALALMSNPKICEACGKVGPPPALACDCGFVYGKPVRANKSVHAELLLGVSNACFGRIDTTSLKRISFASQVLFWVLCVCFFFVTGDTGSPLPDNWQALLVWSKLIDSAGLLCIFCSVSCGIAILRRNQSLPASSIASKILLVPAVLSWWSWLGERSF